MTSLGRTCDSMSVATAAMGVLIPLADSGMQATYDSIGTEPARFRYGDGRFTTVTVSCDGYCLEWCTAVCATTPFTSS